MSNKTNLFELGNLMSLRIGFWSGRRMISRSDLINMGIDPDKIPDELANYGRKLLVSPSEIRAFSRIDQKARTYLANYSIPFDAVNACFVPAKMLPDVEAKLEGYKKEFFDCVDSFIERFGKIKEEVRDRYPDFYDKCLKKWYPSSPENLRSKFTFKWFIFKIANLDNLQETTVADAVAENAILEERKSELRKRMQSEVNGFINDYVSTMRAETIKFCDLMSARVNGKPFGDEEEPKQLTARSLSFFRKHIDKYKELNIFGDNEVQKMLDDFKDQFLDSGVTAKQFDNVSIKNAVSNALTNIRKTAAMENEQTSEFINSLKRKIVI